MSKAGKRGRRSGDRAGTANNDKENSPIETDNGSNVMDDEDDFVDEDGSFRVDDIYIPPPVRPYCSNESHGQRLIITKILNRDFKSYAGDIELGPFTHRFHAIIGPNGSGKSNVIDSMLFVFGYRANKIRCKRLSVLIHNSKKHPNVSSCRVAVHFAKVIDHEDGSREFVHGSEFSIAREAFRNNSSVYTIDDQPVHFRAVAARLKSFNVDLDHNRFLILQGEVESIAMMKPKAQNENEVGHLEYLEDIIGTTRYKEPLAKISVRVEALTEERTVKHNRCRMAEREMTDLKQPMDAAVAYLNAENEHARTKNVQYQKYWSKDNKNLHELTADYEAAQNALKEHDDKFVAIAQKRVEKESQIEGEMTKHAALLKKKNELEQMKKSAIGKRDVIQADMNMTNNRRKMLHTQLKKEEEKLDLLKNLPEKNEKEMAEFETKIGTLEVKKQAEEDKLQINMAKLNEQTQPLRAKKEELQVELGTVEVEVNAAKSELTLAESALQLVQQNEILEKKRFDVLKYGLDDTKAQVRERKADLEQLEASVPNIKAEINVCNRKISESKQEEGVIQKELSGLKSIIEEKEQAMREMRWNNRVLDYLMKRKIEGQLPGLLGRLGDLGGIDAKYDVAISTCCARLDNIVVQDVATGQKCLDFLKKDNVGRATFISVEKMARYENQIHQIQTPENAPRLFDLIRIEDQRLRGVFYFALRDTLVANDLEQATRISYGQKRWRVVSLRGDVIETSGTMSGGGRTQYRGKMGTQVRTKTASSDISLGGGGEEVETIQVKAQELSTRISYLQQIQSEQERKLGELEQALRAKEPQLKRMRTEINCRELQVPQLEEQLVNQQRVMEQTRSDPVEVAEKQNQIAKHKEKFEKCQENTKKYTDQIEAIDQQLVGMQNELVTAIRKHIESLTTQITKLSKHVSKLKVDITTAKRDEKKCEGNMKTTKEEIETVQNDIIRMGTERDQTEKDLEKFDETIARLTEEIGSAGHDSSGAKKEVLALQKQESDGKILRIELEQETQNTKKLINEVNSKLPEWKRRIEQLKLRAIPNKEAPEPLKTYTEEELDGYKINDLQYKVTLQEEELKKTVPNLDVIEEFQRKQHIYMERIMVLEDITAKRNDMRNLFDEIKKRRHDEFRVGFGIITRKLKEMYQMITQGGDAELELVDSLDPFTEGILFSVRPPRKSWKNISNLSGGEKTLSSLALVFALHYFKPSPLYFMDEIDAALDFKNVSIVANYIRDRTKNAQFIIISLRTNMFELADYLTGIYKVDDCTDSVTIQNVVPEFIDVQTASQRLPLSQDNHQPPPFDQLFSNDPPSPRPHQQHNNNTELATPAAHRLPPFDQLFNETPPSVRSSISQPYSDDTEDDQ